MTVLKDDKFENAIRKRIINMNADYMYYRHHCYNTCVEYREEAFFYNPLGSIWQMRIDLRFLYVDKKIKENFEKELRRLML